MKGIREEFAPYTASGRHLAAHGGAGHGELADALLAAWPAAAAVLDATGRLLAWNEAFAALGGGQPLSPGLTQGEMAQRSAIPAAGLLPRPLRGGMTLLEWSAEAAAMAEARRLCSSEMGERLERLATVLEARDLEAARAEAHGLRGLAANFSLATLVAPLREIELACRAGDRREAEAAMDEVTHRMAQALEALRLG